MMRTNMRVVNAVPTLKHRMLENLLRSRGTDAKNRRRLGGSRSKAN